ncbi:MAG: hypothetical protein ABR520_05905 [Mycobacteriales bacterium]|nr:hypothetical protein [Frankia sp.]
MRKPVVALASVLALTALALPTVAKTKPAATRFGKPVKITPDLAYGYEPSIFADRYGNLYATAHKENWQLALGPDSREPTQTRSMSWAWYSADNGATWKNLPTGPMDVNIWSHNFGDEGDMAVDDNGFVYFVDTNVTDITFTAWKTTGRDKVTFDHHLPVAAFGEPVDDRPWVTAHGDGHVFYLGNEGNKGEYPGGQPPFGGGEGNANGPGRYTVYSSYDHGNTWDHLGYSLNDSGWCRPAADHTAGSKYVYVICGNDVKKVYSFVSADDGKTWNRYFIDDYEPASTDSWPSVEVAKDGSLWATHVSKVEKDVEKITLYHSKTHGKSWSKQDITPLKGRFVYQWLSVSPDGKKLGLGTYYRPDAKSPWKVYGAVWKPGEKPKLVSLDDKNPVAPVVAGDPPGDYLGSTFAPDGHLSVIWTRVVLRSPVADADPTGEVPKTLERDIYTARSL